MPGTLRDGRDSDGNVSRGAGGLSAREQSAAMDNLGLQRNVHVGSAHVTFSAATTADRIVDALPYIGRMVTHHTWPTMTLNRLGIWSNRA
jgi:hypothetical protein